MDVDYSVVGENGKSLSYTDFTTGQIRLNPSPLLGDKLDYSEALDVEIGFSLHEASHSQESRSRWGALLKKERNRVNGQWRENEIPAFSPMRVAAYLWNVVEDVRIEAVTSRHWPGFAPYFGAVLDWMWTEMSEHHGLPVEYGPDVAGKLKTVFLSCRYPAQAARLPAEMQPEVSWWTAWQHDYLADRVDTKETIQRGLDHLGEDPATAFEMAKIGADEKKERERGERIRAQIDRLMREGIAGTYGVCVTHDGDVVALDAETAEEVRKLIREGLVEHEVIIKAVGARNPPLRVRRPEETPESRRAYIGKPNAESAALRTALVFRNSAPQHDIKLLKSGTLDDEELYRWGMGDDRVFSERVIEAKPDVFMGLLVDCSGSMAGSKLQTAQRLAQLLAWALYDQEGVETRVWAHTGDLDDDSAAEIYDVWKRGDPLSRLGLLGTLENGDNYDSHAVSYCAMKIMEMPQPQRLLIVLSDGKPAGLNYGGQPAANHVRQVVRWAASRGVQVLQVAVDPYGLRPEDQEAMYPGSWIPFRDTASLPRQLASVMARLI